MYSHQLDIMDWKTVAVTALIVTGCGHRDGSAGTPVASAAYRTPAGTVNIYAMTGANELSPEAAKALPIGFMMRASLATHAPK